MYIQVFLPGLDPLLQVLPPRLEAVYPGGDGKDVAAGRCRREAALPAVVDEMTQRRLGPYGLALPAVAEPRQQRIVTIGVDIRLDNHGIAGHRPGRKAPAVNLRADRLDDDALATFV